MVSVNSDNKESCRWWLITGVHALGISGILSVLIVFLRIPFFKALVTDPDRIFDLSLVIHVNFSVLVWLCSISSILVSMTIQKKTKYFCHSWAISAVGTILMGLSTVSSHAVPIKSNYIPVIDNTTFFAGLTLLFAGVVINTLPLLRRADTLTASPVSAGVYGISAMLSAVLVCFISAHATTGPGMDRLSFYEHVFWGAGHLLQGVFSQAFLVVLLLEMKKCRFTHPYLISAVFVTNTASIVIASASHVVYPSDFAALAEFFTWHMRIAEGIVPLYLVFFALGNIKLLTLRSNRYLLYAAVMFTYGGVLGILSMHGTVTIPAHYHGCVVGMTAAFMGFVYVMLPRLGYRSVPLAWRNIQLGLYTVGQLCHITGLELLGGYGALRKVTYLPDTASKIAKYCFSSGGALAILGGFLFVLLVLSCIYRGRKMGGDIACTEEV
ncbi:cbb3-type cytochrome c oxidase subunit I [Candidatus Anaplasma sp. TIGMIC]|uniref:cbb3-type cytochrome c oxidase subunit I n=1 Tax=Candidatus Anaplasma sp. TIGMIC TaxID=3020713 RepID=UPI00232B607E|nr:cbb3-type cytochrome c oxidase subunit I [Candidatus Anaplasma sp. TIGMIC]MDB1135309.1 cbb3-type cytochrome c oxidase subunit I [Candidatus Anaplasma sp. TIGMIC]